MAVSFIAYLLLFIFQLYGAHNFVISGLADTKCILGKYDILAFCSFSSYIANGLFF